MGSGQRWLALRRLALEVAVLDAVDVEPRDDGLVLPGLTPVEVSWPELQAALAQEIRIMLDDGVVLEAQDVDLCLLLGAGWPFHLGGITPYLDREGISERVTGRRFGGAG